LADFDFILEDFTVPAFLLHFLLLLFFEEDPFLPFPLRLLSELNVALLSLALMLFSWPLADFDFFLLTLLEDFSVPAFLLRFLLLLFFEEEDPFLPFPFRLLSELLVPFLELVLFEEE